MKTRHVALAAVAAGLLGVAARFALDPAGFSGTRLGQLFANRDADIAADGIRVPDIDLADPAGTRHRLAALVGRRPALLNFWASWCAPCLREMPALDAFSRQQGANGVQVVGIALDDAAAVRAFLQRRPVAYPVLVDVPGPADLGARLGNTRGVLPYSVLVDADGRVLRRHTGPLDAPDLARWADATRTRD